MVSETCLPNAQALDRGDAKMNAVETRAAGICSLIFLLSLLRTDGTRDDVGLDLSGPAGNRPCDSGQVLCQGRERSPGLPSLPGCVILKLQGRQEGEEWVPGRQRNEPR